VLSPTGVREVLQNEVRLRCLGGWMKNGPATRPTVSRWQCQTVSVGRDFTTRCGGLFLFVADLVVCRHKSDTNRWVARVEMIPRSWGPAMFWRSALVD